MKLNRIKTVLVEKDVSQTDLAKVIGKSFSTVNAYCCNRQQPSLELLYHIANFLSVKVGTKNWLFQIFEFYSRAD